jgi:hypothetical protein
MLVSLFAFRYEEHPGEVHPEAYEEASIMDPAAYQTFRLIEKINQVALSLVSCSTR